MTGRERALRALAQGPAFPAPVVCRTADPRADGVVADTRVSGAQAWIKPVTQARGMAQDLGLDMSGLLASGPGEAGRVGSQLVGNMESLCEAAKADETDAVPCVLAGADAARSAPMEHGGHWLEVERSLRLGGQPPVIVFVAGRAGPDIDCVADLPCQAFGFEPAAFSADEAGHPRPGPSALAHPSAHALVVDRCATAEPRLGAKGAMA